ncbi:P-loop containing nucleoside triphosphate hydrolase protein [Abortiporus biennis]|nr:P-loop containing nucleoside triphosphate hydrolase protein [Abortiporus biennis]
MQNGSYLQGLNAPQAKAVQHDPKLPLQILAGPGSGKTKVLTSRIAHLITHHSMNPSSICAVTFTNKAANEMKERLTKLLGREKTQQIQMGTFHALCAKFLRKHATLVGLEGNFTVCDADESKKIVSKILKAWKEKEAVKARMIASISETALKEGAISAVISKAKTRGYSPKDVLDEFEDIQQNRRRHNKKPISVSPELLEVTAFVYQDYQRVLDKNNSLDFDDLLLFGVKLFKEHRKVSKWCKHILVDEFQDTNTMQYELMVYIASANKCLTIVGDPDQSIYGWRSAEIENLGKMCNDFPNTTQILLEQNYRSTGSILAASIAIVAEDKNRMPKTLHTTHQPGPSPLLAMMLDEKQESLFVATEIKRLIAFTGGMLNYSDFVILLRYNALSRVFESALQQEGIPSRVLAGHKFFERAEVKDILAYLQIIDNPRYIPAFNRSINVPSRAIGEKTIALLLARATQLGISPLETVENIYDGKIPDIKPAVKRKVKSFIEPIRKLRRLANKGELPSTIIRALLDSICYEDYLKKTQADYESRWQNIQELVNFAVEMERTDAISHDGNNNHGGDENLWTDSQRIFDGDALDEVGFAEVKTENTGEGTVDAGMTPLRQFLQASMLSTDTETQGSDEEKNKERVTISTCHAAKGLEWPVVFIPAVENGTFPSPRAEDKEEERRLLYVACTRAQGLLYLTYANQRMMNGEKLEKYMSNFVNDLSNKNALFTRQIPKLPRDHLQLMATVLHRTTPDEDVVNRMVEEYNGTQANRHPIYDPNADDPNITGFYHDLGRPSQDNVYRRKPLSGSSHAHPGFVTASAAIPSQAQFVNPRALLEQNKPLALGKGKAPMRIKDEPQSQHAVRPPLSPSKSTTVNTNLLGFPTKPHSKSIKPGSSSSIGASSSGEALPISRTKRKSELGPEAEIIIIDSSPPSSPVMSTAKRIKIEDKSFDVQAIRIKPEPSSTSLPSHSAKAQVVEKGKGKGKLVSTSCSSSTVFRQDRSLPFVKAEPASTPIVRPLPGLSSTSRALSHRSLVPKTEPSSSLPSVSLRNAYPADSPSFSSSNHQLPSSSSSNSGIEMMQVDSISSSKPIEQPQYSPPKLGGKKRLGMGRSVAGYSNKKFKAPT